MGLLLSGAGVLVTKDMEKAEVLSATFASLLTVLTGLQEPLVPETSGKVCSKEVPSPWEHVNKLHQVKEHADKLDICKSMGPDGLHPELLVELADVIARTLSIIFENSWQ